MDYSINVRHNLQSPVVASFKLLETGPLEEFFGLLGKVRKFQVLEISLIGGPWQIDNHFCVLLSHKDGVCCGLTGLQSNVWMLDLYPLCVETCVDLDLCVTRGLHHSVKKRRELVFFRIFAWPLF